MMLSVTTQCFFPHLYCVSSVFLVVSATAIAFVDRSLQRSLAVESQSVWPSVYRPGSTGSDSSWGAPHSSYVAFFTICKRRASTTLFLAIADLHIDEYPRAARVCSICSYESGLLKSDPPPFSPFTRSGLSSWLPLSHRESLSLFRPPPPHFILDPPDRRTEPASLSSPDSSRPFVRRSSHTVAFLLYRRGCLIRSIRDLKMQWILF